jgi:hypothetical protein
MTHLLLAAAVLTMRVDYYHTGNEKQEHFSLDRVVVEPLPWPGDPEKNIDTTMRGKYFFEVIDGRRTRRSTREVRVHLRRVGNDGRSEAMNRTFSSRSAFQAWTSRCAWC